MAVATVLTDSNDIEKYIQGAMALGASLLEHLTLPVDKLLLVREGVWLPDGAEHRLQAVGWRLQSMPTILPVHQTFSRFAHQFSKLALWGLDVYSRILYMDADTMARGAIDPVFHTPFREDQYLAGVRDFVDGRLQRGFNMGVALLRPSKREYERLLRLLREDSVPYAWRWAEQGFLQAVYPDFVDLPLEFNGNTACAVECPRVWKSGLPIIRVVHFTLTKPWQCDHSSYSCGLVDEWRAYLRRGEELAQ